jgi:hypothetical protein
MPTPRFHVEVSMSLSLFRISPLLLALSLAACTESVTTPIAPTTGHARSATRTTEPEPDPFEEIALQAFELRNAVDEAWNSASSSGIRSSVSPAPTTLIIPCELLGLRARTATTTVANSGAAVDRAVLRRDLPAARSALSQLDTDVYRGLPIILTYIDCLSATEPPPAGPGDGGRGPLR